MQFGPGYRPVFARSEDDQELPRIYRHAGRKLPLFEIAGVVCQVPAAQMDGLARRIVNLDPIGRFAVFIQQLAFGQRLFAAVARHELADHGCGKNFLIFVLIGIVTRVGLSESRIG